MIALILKFLGPAGIIGLLTSLLLGGGFLLQKGETRHWHKQSDRYEKLYNDDKTAFAATVANYRWAVETARAADAANVERVKSEQSAINQQRDASYEARIADARARADRLHADTQAAGHPGGPTTAPVSRVSSAPGGAPLPAPQAGLSFDDALVATEQAIQLDELIKWVTAQHGVDANGKPAAGGHP